MNEELKTKLLEILTAAQKAGADAYDYALKEAPELAREVVLWQVMDYAAGLALGLTGLALAAWLWREISRGWDKWSEFDAKTTVFPIALGIALIVGGVFTLTSGRELLRAKFAPRVFFIMSCKELLTR